MSKQSRRRRQVRNLIIDRPMQMAVVMTVVGVGVSAACLVLAAFVLLPPADFFDRMSGTQYRSVVITLMASYFGICTLGTTLMAVVLTHRVAGPARVIEQALHGMADGNYGVRASVREKDYLQQVSAAAQRLQGRLALRQAELTQVRSELRSCIAADKLPRAEELLIRLTDLGPAMPEEAAETEAEPAPTTA